MAAKGEDRLWRRLLRFSSFKAGLALVVLALVVSRYSLLTGDSWLRQLVRSVDDRIVDVMFVIRGEQMTTGAVVIVDIDERSLAALGQWPWPRTVLADLVRRVQAQEPRIVGFDIFFPEPDRTSLKNYVPLLEQYMDTAVDLAPELLDNDVVLGQALSEADVIIGYFFQMQDDGLAKEFEDLCPEFCIPIATDAEAGSGAVSQSMALQIPAAYRPISSIPAIGDNALSEGFINAYPDADGTLRRAVLLIRYDGILYPSLALEMLREGLGADPQPVPSPNGMLGLTLGDRFVSTDSRARIGINFRGPERTFSYVSAVDVINGRVSASTFRNKYVLLGTSSWGLRDLRASPFGTTPGVEVHANIIDNVLAGDCMQYDPLMDLGISWTVIAAGGILLSVVLAHLRPLTGALTGLVLLVTVVLGNYSMLFLRQRTVGIVYPMSALVAVYMTVTLVNYLLEGREKRFIRGAFSHYVSGDVVSELLRNHDSLTLAGEEKVLTVLFSDIRGFTDISEQLSAQKMSNFLNEYLTAMTDIILAAHGTVDKFIGDAIMAIWNAPLDDDAHAENAVAAALNMQEELHRCRRDWSKRGLPPIRIGVGINTGVMQVGNMGSRDRFDYTVIGDNVNLASRLEGLTKVYGTPALVSEATRDAAGDRFFCHLVDVVRVKGRTQPVRIFEPMTRSDADPATVSAAESFEDAFLAYQERRFDEARNALEALNREYPDPLYELYLARLDMFAHKPPPEDWDGVFVFTEKA